MIIQHLMSTYYNIKLKFIVIAHRVWKEKKTRNAISDAKENAKAKEH